MMPLPKKIERCPIVDSVVEIRFDSQTHPSAVFGLIFNSFQGMYPNVEKLPILQVPEPIRDADPNFRFKAHYRLSSSDGFSVQVGPDVLVVGAPLAYPGWTEFSGKIFEAFEKVFSLGIVSSVSRLGIRFINFFEEDIFDRIQFDVKMCGDILEPRNTLIRTEIERDGFNNTLQLGNNATQLVNNEPRIGSILDIDTFKSFTDSGEFQSQFHDIVQKGHQVEKEIFFGLLKPDFLESLNPKYE